MNTIETIEVIPIKIPLKHIYEGSYYRMKNRCTIITRVYTSDGIIGEAYNADTDEEQAAVATIIIKELAPLIAGMNVEQTERLWERMLPTTFDQLRDRSLTMQAIACVDTAVWDAVGKARNTPCWRLWGGYRNAVPVIGIGGYYGSSADELVQELNFFAGEQELRGMKFKIGGKTPEEDAERLRLAKSIVPEGFLFAVDANQGYTVDEALRFLRLIADTVELLWFEEPTRWREGNRGLRDVRWKGNVRVAAGQSEISGTAMREMIVGGAVDVLNFDASWGGGPSEWRRVAAAAGLFGLQMGHHEEGHLSAHLLASVPHGTFMEVFSPTRDPIFWTLLANRSDFVSGMQNLPEGPGLGWQLDEAIVAKYRIDA